MTPNYYEAINRRNLDTAWSRDDDVAGSFVNAPTHARQVAVWRSLLPVLWSIGLISAAPLLRAEESASAASNAKTRLAEVLREQRQLDLARVQKLLAAVRGKAPAHEDFGTTIAGQTKIEEFSRQLSEIEALIAAEKSADSSVISMRSGQLSFLQQQIENFISEATVYIVGGEREIFLSYRRRLEDWIQEQGTKSMPRQGGTPLYGEARVMLVLLPDGSIQRTQILESSSNAIGQHALSLLQTLEPFEPFAKEMMLSARRVALILDFKFLRGEASASDAQTR